MIIGNELARVLEDFYIEIKGIKIPVKFEYGDQEALQKFITYQTKNGLQKLPLIFYVVNPIEDKNGNLTSKTELIIMSKTKHESLSKIRFIESYQKFIHPIYLKLIKTIDRSKTLYLRKENKTLIYDDKANYGMTQNGEISKEKSKVTEYVDARIIKINIELKQGC